MCLYLCDFLHSSKTSVVLTFTARVGLGHSSIVGAWTLSVSCAIFSPNICWTPSRSARLNAR